MFFLLPVVLFHHLHCFCLSCQVVGVSAETSDGTRWRSAHLVLVSRSRNHIPVSHDILHRPCCEESAGKLLSELLSFRITTQKETCIYSWILGCKHKWHLPHSNCIVTYLIIFCQNYKRNVSTKKQVFPIFLQIIKVLKWMMYY